MWEFTLGKPVFCGWVEDSISLRVGEWWFLKACVFKAEVRVHLPFVFPHPHPFMPLQAAFAHFWSPATITRDNWSDLAGFHLCQCEMSTLSFPLKRSWTKSVSYWFFSPKWTGMNLQLTLLSKCLLLHKGGNTRKCWNKKGNLTPGAFFFTWKSLCQSPIEFFLNCQIWHFCHSCTKLTSRGFRISKKKITSTGYWTHNTNPTLRFPAPLTTQPPRHLLNRRFMNWTLIISGLIEHDFKRVWKFEAGMDWQIGWVGKGAGIIIVGLVLWVQYPVEAIFFCWF